ncbi:MAG: hypothetical protein WD552_02695 [Candidatus Paceibacterota bacterium]
MHKQLGFIKAALVIITAVVLLAVSGISVREHLNPSELASTTEQVAERGENLYTQRLEKPLNTFIITPATVAWEHIEQYGVGSVAGWLEDILN